MSKIFSPLNNDKGSVIIVAIIILALLTIVGISGTSTSTIEVRIATNGQDHQLDFYVADSGWNDAAMFLESQSGAPEWINGEGTVVKNFGSDDNMYAGEPPAPDFNALTPDSVHADGFDNDGDGNIDEAGETAYTSLYGFQYFYEVEHLPDDTTKVAGSSAKYQRHFFTVTSNAKRANLANSTAEIEVTLSKIYPTGYN